MSDQNAKAQEQRAELLARSPTLRDQFAMAALSGLLSNGNTANTVGAGFITGAAYVYADAMLAERKRSSDLSAEERE